MELRYTLLFWLASVGLAASQTPLAYSFKPNSTNLYMAELQSTSEAGVESMKGPLLIVCRTNSGSLFQISVKSFLTNSTDSSLRRMASYSPTPNRAPFLLSGMDQNASGPSVEFTLNAAGRILKSPRNPRYLTPTGPFHSLVFESLDNLAVGTAEEIQITDSLGGDLEEARAAGESFGYGMQANLQGPLYLAQNRFLSATRIMDGGTNWILRTNVATSVLIVDSLPRVSITGEHRTSVLGSTGTLLSRESKFRINSVTEPVTRRATVTLSLRLLDETGAQQAIADLTAVYPSATYYLTGRHAEIRTKAEVFSAADLRPLITEASAPVTQETIQFMNRLANASFAEDTIPLVGDAIAALPKAVSIRRDRLLFFISKTATKVHADKIAEMVEKGPRATKSMLLDTLVRLRDKRAIDPLVESLSSGAYSSSGAAFALIQFGADAEPAALRLLAERHSETKRTACEILSAVGTKRSIEPLKALVESSEEGVSSRATSALKAVIDRSSK